jgi:radical SAM protein with 4Fe4S-binding SPASM domain
MQVYVKDTLNLLSKLTARRFLNISKLWLSYSVSRITRKPFHKGMPAVLEVEPTTSCNLRCPQCISGLREFTRDTGMLDIVLFRKIIDEVHHDLISLVLYFQGEPFLNKNFLSFVKYASDKNIYTTTSTNAHYFTDDMAKATIQSGLDRLTISIDGMSQDTYSQYRIGGNLDKVIEGTQQILKWKKQLNSTTPHVIWQFIVFKHNEHEVEEVKKTGRLMGVDEVDIKTAQVYGYETDNTYIPSTESLSRYRKGADGNYTIKSKLLNECWRMWKGSVITWDGLVVPCCFDKDAKHAFGNVMQQSFVQVWQNNTYDNFRRTILESREKIDICKNCSEGIKVYSN